VNQTPKVCPSGEVLLPNPARVPACSFPDCPLQCPNPTERRTCPGPGGRLIERTRATVPIAGSVPGTAVCPWDDCPPYEPCDDRLRVQRLCNRNGQCRRGGLMEIVCDCDAGYSGNFCDIEIQNRRKLYTLSDRAFGWYSCQAVMCSPAHRTTGGHRCWAYTDSDQTGLPPLGIFNDPKMWVPIPKAHTILAASDGNLFYFANDEGHCMVVQIISTNNIVLDRNPSDLTLLDRDCDIAISLGAASIYTDFSYKDIKPGVLPPAPEADHVINWGIDLHGDGACPIMVYLTVGSVAFYHENDMSVATWNEKPNGSVEIEKFEICLDRCVDSSGTRETCNDAGLCDRQTGCCHCNFGYYGLKCQSKDSRDDAVCAQA